MTNKRLYRLVHHFKEAILAALDDPCFGNDIVFYQFPRGCCGDTSCLLAEYLHLNGFETIYVCGSRKDQSHAWLVLKDHTVRKPTPHFFTIPDDIRDVLNAYGNDVCDTTIGLANYKESDLINGTIIDITADQFGQQPIYIGYMDEFHKQFTFLFAHDHTDLGDNPRLHRLYRTITNYIV